MNDAEDILKTFKDENEKLVFNHVKVSDVREEIKSVYNGTYINPISTGIEKLDEHFNTFLGMLFLITGFPQSGKSELLRFIACNWVKSGRGKVCFFSPENETPILYTEIINSVRGNMDYKVAEDFVNEHFEILEINENNGLPEIKSMIDEMEEQSIRGYNFFIIDPMNWLTSTTYNGNGFEALRATLTFLKQFAKRTKSVVGYVEHPKTPIPNKDGSYPKANIFMVNGGTMHNNKIDGCLIMHRIKQIDNDGISVMSQSDHVIVEVAKLKFQKYLGTPNSVTLNYDWQTGNYY